MELTWEEIKEISLRLDEVIGKNWYDISCDVLQENNRDSFEVSDEDIQCIKEQLKRIL
jgi:hypothetical protein